MGKGTAIARGRRHILQSTAVGAGLALGSSSLGAAASAVQDGAGTNSQHVLTTFQATVPEFFVTLDADDPSAGTVQFSDANATGDFLVDGEIYDDGTWAATSVSIPDGAAMLDSIDVAGLVDGYGLGPLLDSLTIEGFKQLVVTAVDSMNLDSTQIQAVQDMAQSFINVFGIDFGSHTTSKLINTLGDFLQNPTTADVQDMLNLVEFVYGQTLDTMDDIWALLGIQDGAEIVDILSDLSIAGSGLMGQFDIALGATGVGGKYEPNGVVTVSPDTVDATVAFAGAQLFDVTLTTGAPTPPENVALTSGWSGAVLGTGNDVVGSNPSFTLVDNEFVLGLDSVDLNAVVANQDVAGMVVTLVNQAIAALNIDPQNATVDDFITAVIGLLQDVGLGRLFTDTDIATRLQELLAALDVSVSSVTLEEVSNNIDFETLLGQMDLGGILAAIDVNKGVQDSITDESGRHTIQASVSGTVDDPAALQNLVEVEPVIEGNDPPTDTDGDGLYTHVRGEDQFTIADVQALFDNLDNPQIQNNAARFNFQGSNPDEVTIFDVQALYQRL